MVHALERLLGRVLISTRPIVARGSESGAEERAEAFVEGVAGLHGDRLGEAAGGDHELVEKADAAELDQSIAVPVWDEPNRCLPLTVRIVLATRIQTEADRLIANRDHPTTDSKGCLTLMVIQIDVQLLREQIAGGD